MESKFKKYEKVLKDIDNYALTKQLNDIALVKQKDAPAEQKKSKAFKLNIKRLV
jgi:hypothetical protein